MVLFNLSYTTW